MGLGGRTITTIPKSPLNMNAWLLELDRIQLLCFIAEKKSCACIPQFSKQDMSIRVRLFIGFRFWNISINSHILVFDLHSSMAISHFYRPFGIETRTNSGRFAGETAYPLLESWTQLPSSGYARDSGMETFDRSQKEGDDDDLIHMGLM